MPDYELSLWDYWRIIKKRKWRIVIFAIGVTLSSWLYSRAQVPVYKTSATIKIEKKRAIAGVIVSWDTTGLETETRTIQSHKVVKKVAEILKMIPEGADTEETNHIVRGLQSKISTERSGSTNLIRITVKSNNAKETMKVANTLADVYILESKKERNKDARGVVDFVEEQLEKYERALKISEAKLEMFREQVPAAGSIGDAEVMQTDEFLAALKKRLVALQMELFTLKQTCTEDHPRVIEVKDLIAKIKKNLFTPKSGSQFIRLNRDIEINKDLYFMFRKKLEEANIVMAEQSSEVEVVEPAILPKYPISPNTKRNVIFGLLMGVFLGIVVVFVTETLDTSISTIEDVEEYLKLPVLGVIPFIKSTEENRVHLKGDDTKLDKERQELLERLVGVYKKGTMVAEAYRSMQTNIKFAGLDKVGNALIFTSVGDQEGKTLTTTNCALSFAQMGRKVVIVDADLRRPAIHRMFGVKREGGLTDILTESIELEKAIKTIEDILLGELKTMDILKTNGLENLHIITCGHHPSNPTQLVNSPQMDKLIVELKKTYDVVLFDSAPVLPIADSTILASKVDGAILIYQVGKVARGGLKRVKMQLENVKAKPIGVVLNNIRASEMEMGYPYYPYYRYYKSYYSEEDKKSAQS